MTCLPLSNCPGLESNQHDPKVTSPSSYSRSVDNDSNNNDLDIPPTPSGALSGVEIHQKDTNQAPARSQDLVEIVAVWPDLPEHIKAAIKALITSYQADTRGDSHGA